MMNVATEKKPKSAVTPTVAANATAVHAVLTDIGGIVWGGALVIINFVPAPNIPGPYFFGDQSIDPFAQVARLNAGWDGSFNAELMDNTTITPAGSTWQFTIAPSATMPAVVFRLMIAGNYMDISTIFTAQSYQLQASQVMSMPVPRAYSDADVAVPPNEGQIYYDSTSHTLKVWSFAPFSGIGWKPIGISQLGSGSDLNDLRTTGDFHIPAGSTVNAPNDPALWNNDLLVQVYEVGNQVLQRLSPVYQPEMFYQRSWNDAIGGGTNMQAWGGWYKYSGVAL